MKKNKYWILLGVIWVALVAAYLVWWPPKPSGTIHSLQPLPDGTCIVLQQRWSYEWQNRPILYRMNADQDILWQIELPRINKMVFETETTFWADEEIVAVNLPLPPAPGASISLKYQVMVFDVEEGKEKWRSEEMMMAPEEDEHWMIESNWDPLFVSGSEKFVFSVHQYQRMWPSPKPKHGNLRKIFLKAWDRKTGELVWERDDLRPDGLQKPLTPSWSASENKWAQFRTRDSVFNSYPTNLLSIVPVEEHNLMAIFGNHDTRIFLDMETGLTLGKIRDEKGGRILNGAYYYIQETQSSYPREQELMEFDFASLQFRPTPWWQKYKDSHPTINDLERIHGISTLDGLNLFTLSYSPLSYYRAHPAMLAVDPEKQEVVWRKAFRDDENSAHYPLIPASFNEIYPQNGALDREWKGTRIYYASTRQDLRSYAPASTSLCRINPTEPSFEILSFYNVVNSPVVFPREELIYIFDGFKTLSVFDPVAGELIASRSHGLLETANIMPPHIEAGLIWVNLGTKIMVLDGKTLEVMSGSDAILVDELSTTRELMGFED